MKFTQKLKSFVLVTAAGTGVFAGLCVYKGNEKFYKNVIMPATHILDPELTHELGIFVAKNNLFPRSSYADHPSLNVNLFGKQFSNPVGVAAGFDKQAQAVECLHNIGFGFVEVGSVTPEPQSGNPKPRVFRLPEDLAVINRYGFNSDGHEVIYNRIHSLKQNEFSGIVGVNLGKNKTSPNAIDDYVRGIKKFGHIVDYLVINISSPNTPGLRSMQSKEILQDLLTNVIKTCNDLPEGKRPPILLKLAPDLTTEDRKDIATIVQQPECRVDGLVVCNTTISRPKELQNSAAIESGGLSGRPLTDSSTKMIAEMYKLTNGMTIIGVGGIFTGADAYEKIKAGASLVQIYTALIYQGPPCVTSIKKELAVLLAKDGYNNISEAVGKDAQKIE